MADPQIHSEFFGELLADTAELHQKTVTHPMVRAIGSGVVPAETFRFYLEQDFQFLIRYLRMLSLAAASAPDLHSMRPLAELVHSTLAVELDALGRLYASFDGNPAHLESVKMAPACRAYTDHLLVAAAERDLLLILAAMLPCQWGYGDIGRRLKEEGLPEDARFAAWISEYASDEYHALVAWAVAELNRLAAVAGPPQLQRARAAFSVSAEYELAFWEMAWTSAGH